MPRQRRSWLIGTLIVLGLSPAVSGGYLDPGAFTSLGTLDLTSGNYTINTNGAPTLLDSSNNVLFTGTTFNQGGSFDSTISVLDFSSINIGAGVNITIVGSNPLALLSQGNVTLAGVLNANGSTGANSNSQGGNGVGGAGGAGGGAGGNANLGAGQGPGGGPGGIGGIGAVQAGGGSYGGIGGANALGVSGSTYGNLFNFLLGGSGGGATGTSIFDTVNGAGGGGGGGAVELGALGTINFNGGSLTANGGQSGVAFGANAGGGSGGGLIIDAPTINVTGSTADIAADGGANFGGGGRILFLTDTATINQSGGNITVQPGGGANDQTMGTIDYGFLNPGVVPEPPSLLMVALGSLGVVLLSRARRLVSSA